MVNMFQQRLKQQWLSLLVNGIGMVLCVRTGWLISVAPLTEGWVLFTNSALLRDIVVFTGKSGLLFLVLSLICTPLARLLGWTPALQVRKALGLWGFGFACLHSLFFLQGKPLFVGWNIGAELGQALQSMFGIIWYGSKVPYAKAGVYALLLLLPLALTSNRLAMRRLGKNWKRLHRLVYLAVPVAIYHYWWRTTSDFPPPPLPDYWQPILFAVAAGLLLIVRIPLIRRWVTGVLAGRQHKQPVVMVSIPRLAPPYEHWIGANLAHNHDTTGTTLQKKDKSAENEMEKSEAVLERV